MQRGRPPAKDARVTFHTRRAVQSALADLLVVEDMTKHFGFSSPAKNDFSKVR